MVSQSSNEKLKQNLATLFLERYGPDAKIKSVVCDDASMEGFGYKVLVEYQSEGSTKTAEHYVRSLMGSSHVPCSIDAGLTPAGKAALEDLAEFGLVQAAAFNQEPKL
jgi:hypothetical protein